MLVYYTTDINIFAVFNPKHQQKTDRKKPRSPSAGLLFSLLVTQNIPNCSEHMSVILYETNH